MNKNHPFRQLLKEPNFVKLWVSQLLSQLTINLVNFSILTRIFEVTESSVAVSLLWLAYSLPALFFAPISGAVVDRFSRRKLMVITNVLQAGVVSLYLFVRADQIFVLYVLVFMYSLLDQLYLPAQQASLPSVVEKEKLTVANGIFLLTQQASFLVGFGLGGVFLHLLGRTYTTIASTMFLLAAGLAVFLLPRDWSRHKRPTTNWEEYLSELKKGYLFVRGNRSVLYPLLLIAFTQMLITMIAIIIPSYTQNVLGVNINYASAAFVVPGAVGALTVTYFLPRIFKNQRKKNIIEMGLGAATISLFALALIGLTGICRFPLAVAIAIGIGVSIAAIMVPSQTLLQENTPTWFRGRVYSSLNFLLIFATTAPLLISAAIADIFGVATMIAMTATLLFVFLLFMKKEGDYVLANGFGL